MQQHPPVWPFPTYKGEPFKPAPQPKKPRPAFVPALFISMAMLSSAAVAGPCIANDRWTGQDKTKHFTVGAAIGSAGTLVFKDADAGFLLGVAAAIAKEARDSRRAGNTCSLQDAAATVAGAAAGAYGTGWLVLPKRDGVTVAFAARF